MLFGAVILFFLTGVVTVYAIIQTGKNYALQALMIPLILVSTIFAGYAIFILQGTPKNGIPDGEVEVVWVELQKPNILFLARGTEEGDSPIPKYYRIPYNDQNKKEVNKMKKKMEMGVPVQGEFKQKQPLPGGNEPPQGEFEFDDIRRDGLPPKQGTQSNADYGPAGEFESMEGVDGSIQNAVRSSQGPRQRLGRQDGPEQGGEFPQGQQMNLNSLTQEDVGVIYDIYEEMELEESKEYLERYE